MKKFAIISLISAAVLLPNISWSKSKCYKEEYRECKKKYREEKTACRNEYNEAKRTCGREKTQAISQCKKEKNSTICRVPTLSREDKEKFKKEKDQLVKACKEKFADKKGACGSVKEDCYKKCYKNCTKCNDQEIKLCREKCSEKVGECKLNLKKQELDCNAQASLQIQDKRTARMLELWKEYYNCLYNRTKKLYACTGPAIKNSTNCIYTSLKTYYSCLNKASSGFKLCLSEAKAKCAGK